MKPQELHLPIDLAVLRRILRKHRVLHASIFGSYARGEARADSDLDVLVSYAPGVSLFGHFDLRDELEKYSGKKVDVVSDRALSRHIRPYIEKEKVSIL
ncbi:MAG TPA: nucleotidyltransferase family protein [Candidatus Saccharimonadales bacterium]|nr:nucleotidyltransferase family protein [Candidatus Saccharimonadales bacterium]